MSTLPEVQAEGSAAVALPRRVARAARRPEIAWTTARFLVDVGMLALGIVVAAAFGPFDDVAAPPVLWLAVYPALVLVLFRIRGMYAPRLRLQILDDLRGVVSATAIAAMIVVSARAIVGDDSPLAAQTVRQWIASAVLLAVGRVGLGLMLRQSWRSQRWTRPTLIIGAGNVGQLVARRLIDQPDSGLAPIGFLDKEPLDERRVGLPVLGASWDLEARVQEHDIRNAIVTFSTAPHSVLLDIVDRCDRLGVTVSLVPRLYEKVTQRLTVEHLGGLPLLTIDRVDPKGWQFELKYAADRVLAALGLLITLPLTLVAAIAIRVTMGKTVFFRQQRVGLDGKTFELVKFRSMLPPDTWANGEAPAAAGDDRKRLTRVGSFVRATSIDELPQLWNVVKGDMSLIGPRPERPEFCEIFEDYVYRYGDRNRVKSGISGWAQVHGIGRGDDRFSPETLTDRVEWDNFYIENWSLWLDVKITLMTVAAIFSFRQT